MPKAILEFNLPEEKLEYQDAVNGSKRCALIQDLDNHLRGILKYTSDNYTEKELEMVRSIRTKLYELTEEYEVKIWE